MKAAILITFASILLLSVFWGGPDPRLTPGVLVPYEPDQDPIEAMPSSLHINGSLRVRRSPHWRTSASALASSSPSTTGGDAMRASPLWISLSAGA